MSKIIDITNKLKFKEKPSVQIKGVVLPVNNDAPSMLEVMAIMEDAQQQGRMSAGNFKLLEGLLFDEEARGKLKALKLDIEDYTEMIQETALIAVNRFEEEGEAETPATT